MNFEVARTQMLGQQIRAWEVLDDRVLAAMQETPRERFVPEAYRELAFADMEIPIGDGQTMMYPKIEGRLLQALQVAPGDEVLEVGTGTGFLTACLAKLGGTVTSVDIIERFIPAARERLHELGIDNVELQAADAMTLSYTSRFDAIALTGSLPDLDERFIRMLKPHGRLFVVVGRPPVMEARLITMQANGDWVEESLFETLLAPLKNAERPEPFVL
jgi:protein-L-isoaspartate(D-aspartate) O-methyltransferase